MYSFAAGAQNVLSEILDELKKLNSGQSTLQEQVLGFRREMNHIKSVMAMMHKSTDVEVLGSAPHPVDLQPGTSCDALCPKQSEGSVNSRWKCPICFKPLAHKESFAGHIRKLVHGSTRPKCHMNPADDQHQALVARFPGANFYERAKAFCNAFYSEVRWSCTKRDDDDQSFEHVTAWFNAALSGVEVNFPVYDPRYRSCSRKQRLDSDADASRDCSNPKSSSQSSFDSIESFFSNDAW